MLPQIPLGLEAREIASFDNFVGSANLELLAQLRAISAAAGEQYLFLWGVAGSGKCHLLQAGCHAAQHYQQRSAYIPLREATRLTPEVLDAIPPDQSYDWATQVLPELLRQQAPMFGYVA